MINLNHEEEALLRPEYEQYCAEFPRWGFPIKYALSFDDWWRAKADNIKDDMKG